MKKILFLFGILATTASVLSSCDAEDGDNNNEPVGNVTMKKLLISLTEQKGDEVNTTKFEYDANGFVVNFYASDSMVQNYLSNWTTLKEPRHRMTNTTNFNSNGSFANVKYVCNDTVVVKDSTYIFESIDTEDYQYDADRHLISYVSQNHNGSGINYNLTWKDGNITDVDRINTSNIHDDTEIGWSYNYTSEDSPTPIENKTDLLFFYGLNLFNRFGMATKNLPVSITNKLSGIEKRIVWTVDSDGYPIKAESYITNDNKIVETLEFTWK